MPYILEDLVISRVDLVDEGANSASFIELYKRKEQSKMNVEEILSNMKPEHASVIQEALNKSKADLDTSAQELITVKEQLNVANDELAKASSELETLKAKGDCECDGEADENGTCKACGKPKKVKTFDEAETMKSMPAEAKELFEKMKSQKEAAEAELRKAKDAEAIAKAKELKAIPVDQSKLVEIVKSANSDLLDLLTVVNAAIEGTVLGEVGKSNTSNTTGDAWAKIDSKAAEIAKRDSVTKAKAISIVIKENPELYTEYLQGGAN